MRKIALALAILGTALVPTLYAAPAHAQRTWVSGVGDDANPCSRTAPCKTFAGAISKTGAGSEINCLDSGGFGAVTITKSISIICIGVEGGVLVSGTPGITVAAGPTDKVVLRGLDLQGLGTGTNGVNFVSGLYLVIDQCNIQQFATNGVNVASNTANARVLIKDTTIVFNGTNGSANTGGIAVQGNGVGNQANILNTVVEGNQNYSLQVTGGANAAVIVSSYFNPTGVNSVNSGAILSFGPSNTVASGGPTSPAAAFK